MCTLYILLLALGIFFSCSFVIDENPRLENDIIATIISEFTNHNVIFHYDNFSKFRIDKIFTKADARGTAMMQNYELPIQLRPDGYQFLHIILLKNYTQFQEFTRKSIFSLTYVDVLFFIIDNCDNENIASLEILHYWPKYRVNRAGSMFVLNTWNLTLYSVCFYCGRKQMILQNIATLSDNATDNFNITVSLVDIHKNRFQDFNGYVFNVAYAIYKPFFWARIIKVNNKSYLQMQGSEAALIHTLIRKLNIKFYMEEFKATDDNWNKLVEAVANDSFDFAIGGITLTNQRMEIVDFTTPINTEAYTVLYSVYDDPWMSWQNIIFPFNFLVWLVLILVVSVISCLFTIAVVNITEIGGDMNFMYFFRQCLRLLVEQTVPGIKLAMRSRISILWLMILWILFALIMTNAYKCKLTSFLITSRIEEFDTIDDLVGRKYKYFVSKKDSFVIRKYMENSSDQKLLHTLKRSRNDTEFCESILLTTQKKVAVIDEETNFQYGIDKYCPKVTSSAMFSNLRITRNVLYASTHAWPMMKNAPFRTSVNRVIGRLFAGGLFQHWTAEYGKIVSPVLKSYQRQVQIPASKRFTWANMLGPGIVWGLGIFAATVCLLVEVVMWKCRKVE